MGMFFNKREKEKQARKECNIVEKRNISIKDVTIVDNKGSFCFDDEDHICDYFGNPIDYSDFLDDQLQALYDLGKKGYNISAFANCAIPAEYYKEFAKLEDEGINPRAIYQISQCCYRRNDYYGNTVNHFDKWVFNAWSKAAKAQIPLITLIPGDPNSWDAGQITAMLDIYKSGNIGLFNQINSSYDPQLLTEISRGCVHGVDMSSCANPMLNHEQVRNFWKEKVQERDHRQPQIKDTRQIESDMPER